MKPRSVVLGGVLAGVAFYAISLLVWALFKFLPIIPLPISVPSQGLGWGWQAEHLLVSIVIGLLWAAGYALYGKMRPGGWLYGFMVYLIGAFPAFLAYMLIAPPPRSVIVYGALVSFIGALFGGKIIAAVSRK